ncbi:WD40 repeat domain-containing protein [Adhaeribacter pallidiroseus]|uniref:WD repeat-containing protein 5 like protein n=1 Tax=Adhaeribacter pallidiroseus TaxID=2072847 RepID=A0A369QT81_9BACT|nr:WD40 repeat domain-containing protein [Adhaeribacter pallidiroseus]RDC66526.1 WD repeat-containing protein 5 like protein [Adhaeribacter pallidiroseus]
MTKRTIQVHKNASLTGHRDCVYTLERSGQEEVFYSAAGDGMVVAWDLRDPGTGELIAQVPSSVYALRYVPGKNWLLVGHNHNSLQVIDLFKKTVVATVALPPLAIFDIAYSELNQCIYVALGDGGLGVIDAELFVLKKILKLADKSARSLAINEATQELAIGFSDHVIRILDLAALTLKYEITGHTNSVFTVAYSPDGQYLLSGGRDAHLKVWQITGAYKAHTSIVAHLYAINHITYSPGGQFFATGSMDKSIKVWDAQTFRLLKVIDKVRHAGHGTSVNKLLWSGYRNQLVSGSDDRTISVWELNFSLTYEDYTVRD